VNRSECADRVPGLTRRNALRHAWVAGAGLGIVQAVWAADDAAAQTAATPEVSSIPPVVRSWIDAYNAGDYAAMAALYAADGTYEDVPNAFAAQGEEIPSFLATAEQGFADVHIEITSGFGASGWAAVEYLFHATNRGMVPVPGTEGKSFTSRTVTVFELEGDTIRRSSDYYDLVGLLTQLGAMPAMAPGAASPAATPAG